MACCVPQAGKVGCDHLNFTIPAFPAQAGKGRASQKRQGKPASKPTWDFCTESAAFLTAF